MDADEIKMTVNKVLRYYKKYFIGQYRITYWVFCVTILIEPGMFTMLKEQMEDEQETLRT